MKTAEKPQKARLLKKQMGKYKTLDEAVAAKVKQADQLLATVDWSTFKRK